MVSIPHSKINNKNEDSTYENTFYRLGMRFGRSCGNEAITECPFCGSEKFYFNKVKGLWHCKSGECNRSGNAIELLQHIYETALEDTTSEDRNKLKNRRQGVSSQAFEHFGLAYLRQVDLWLLPFKNEDGAVVNLVTYDAKGITKNLAKIPTRLFGYEQLFDDTKRTVLLCEGPWDAIALWYLLPRQKRNDYAIIAQPGSNFKLFGKLLAGRKVQALYDNDAGGRGHAIKLQRFLKENEVYCDLKILEWPEGTPDETDINDLVPNYSLVNKTQKDANGSTIISFLGTNCKKATNKGRVIKFTNAADVKPHTVKWLWEGRMQLETLVSFSGRHGTHKSTIAKDLAARVSAGLPMPHEVTTTLPPSHVLYFTSEDSESQVKDLIELHGGDLKRIEIYDKNKNGGIDLLEDIDGLAAQAVEMNVKLIVVDALNSFIEGNVCGGDAVARKTLSDRLQRLARLSSTTVLGVRNWGRDDSAANGSQKSLGATSVADVSRCVLNTADYAGLVRLGFAPQSTEEEFYLVWEKVSDAKTPLPIGFRVISKNKGKEDSHKRVIKWGSSVPVKTDKTIDKPASVKRNTPKPSKPVKRATTPHNRLASMLGEDGLAALDLHACDEVRL